MKILKQKRKTLSVSIDTHGEIIVKAPLRTPKIFIQKFLEKHARWIVSEQEKRANAKKIFQFGEQFYFLGKVYTLKKGNKKAIIFDKEYFYTAETEPEKIQELFTDFYKKEAKSYISKKVEALAKKLDCNYTALRITSAKTRWGSCSSKKSLNFSRRLILAPATAIEYVIIHELSHLTHMNHSGDFRNLVASYAHKIGLENWQKERTFLKHFYEVHHF